MCTSQGLVTTLHYGPLYRLKLNRNMGRKKRPNARKRLKRTPERKFFAQCSVVAHARESLAACGVRCDATMEER